MKYKAYLKQAGEGCDYTIGCAQTVINIEANNFQEAYDELKYIISEDYSDDECLIDYVELYEISNISLIDVQEIYNEIDEKNQLEEQKRIEDKERKEFERLKRKYGKDFKRDN